MPPALQAGQTGHRMARFHCATAAWGNPVKRLPPGLLPADSSPQPGRQPAAERLARAVAQRWRNLESLPSGDTWGTAPSCQPVGHLPLLSLRIGTQRISLFHSFTVAPQVPNRSNQRANAWPEGGLLSQARPKMPSTPITFLLQGLSASPWPRWPPRSLDTSGSGRARLLLRGLAVCPG